MHYDELISTEIEGKTQRKLIQIRQLENELFEAIELRESSTDESQRSFLTRRINEMQGEYSRIHI